jgi:indolepyruvate ferredoxin oxidoreductase
VVSASPKAAVAYRAAMPAVINTAEMPTGDIVRNRDASLAVAARLRSIAGIVGPDRLTSFDANAISDAMFGDTVFANVMMLGAAWQNGLVPVSVDAVMRAIELNDVAIDTNKRAFACGRLAVAAPDFIASLLGPAQLEETLDQIIARRAEFLTAYQDISYAARYLAVVKAVRADELNRLPGSELLTQAVARALFKLMAYKDEYEVARLHTDTGLKERLQTEFEGDFEIKYHLAPPLLPAGRDARGRPLKRTFGSWIEPGFRALARLKFLRGTRFDPFGHTRERRMERHLIRWYESILTEVRPRLHAETIETLVEIASLPMDIRGYGPVKDAAVETVMTKLESLRTRLPHQ